MAGKNRFFKLFLYFSLVITLYSQNGVEEDIVIKVIIRQKEEMVEGKIINDDIYIKKNDFYNTFELEPSTNKSIEDIKNEEKKKVSKNLEIIELNGVSYVNIGKKQGDEKLKSELNLKKYNIDLDEYILKVDIPWELQSEIENERERKRNRLQKFQEEPYEKEEWKMITPGILNVGYAKDDFSESDEYLYYNYTNNLFYGSTNIEGRVNKNEDNGEDRFEVDYGYWERDVLENKKMVLGDTFRRLPFNVGDKNEIVGYGMGKKNSWDSTMSVTDRYIKGYAPTGTMVELYENGILREYKIATSGEYTFKVDLYNGSKEYVIKKYLSNGEILEEKVTLGADEDILPKGEFDYYYEGGQLNGHSEYKTYAVGTSYGVIDDLTLILGGFNIYDEDYQNSDFLMTGEAGTFTVPYINSSVIHTVKVAKDNNDNMIYRYEVEATKGKGTVMYRKEDYSELDEKMRSSTKKNDDIYWSYKIGDVDTRIGTSYTEYDENSRDRNYYLNANKTFFGNILLNLGLNRREDRERGESENSFLPSVSYMVRRDSKLYKIVDTISLNTSVVEADTQYGLNVSKNYDEWDYYLGYNIDNSSEWSASFTLSWTPGKKGKIQTSIYSDDKGTRFGSFVETNVFMGNKSPEIGYTDSIGKGSIGGRVYVDRNGNGKYDEGYDDKIPKAKMSTNSTDKMISNEGIYTLGALNTYSPETVKVDVDSEFLPYNISNKKEKRVKLNPGGRYDLDFGFIPNVTVISNIKFKNDFFIEEVNKLLADFEIEFKNLSTGKVERYSWGESDFLIKNFEVGEYSINLIYKGDEKIKIYKSEYYFKLTDKEETEIDFEVEKLTEDVYSLTVKHEGSQLAALRRELEGVTLKKDKEVK